MKKFTIVTAIIVLAACTAQHKTINTTTVPTPVPVDGKLFASVFQQRAAEYKALCFQAYNIAKLRLDEALVLPSAKPMAIVSDIDETVLDNSAYAVHQSLQGKDYESASWLEWVLRAEADTLAGAKTFFNYAASKKVEVFYITNRKENERAATLKNLQAFGFPYADDAHLILRQTIASKEVRRQTLAATHNIVLLLGDNLADFSSLFDSKTEEERLQNVQMNAALFSKKFIVLPNSSYGDWEPAFYKQNLSLQQKDSVIKTSLRRY
jgi:5'-nucleotidase (lipoprotein e(P4) family)